MQVDTEEKSVVGEVSKIVINPSKDHTGENCGEGKRMSGKLWCAGKLWAKRAEQG